MTRRDERRRRGRSRRRAALALVIALVVALAAEGAARLWEDDLPEAVRWYDAASQRKIDQMDRLGSADVVFAGTSMAWQGMDPTTFTAIDAEGRSAYNAGLAGGIPGVMEPWLIDEVTPRLEPELVIWGLSTLDLAPAYGEDNIAAYEDAPAVAEGLMAELDRRAASVSALVRQRESLRRPEAWWGEGPDDPLFAAADSLLGPLGERREFDVVADRQRAQLAAGRLRDWQPSHDDLATIRHTVRELTDEGISVVLTPMPTPPRFVALHPDGEQDFVAFDEALRQLATDLDVPLIDVAVGYDDDDFVDYTHLDQAGARRFTRQLTAALNGSESGEEPPAEWELLADVVPDGTEETADRRTTVADGAAEVGRRSVLAAENLHSALSPSKDLFGIEVPLVWANGFHRAKQLQLAELAAEGESPDVVFAGTSKVWYGIDAELFTEVDGRSSYNAGLPAAGPEAQESWLLDVVEPTVEPEVVIWGVSAYDVSGRLDSTSQRIVDAVELQQQLFAPLAWSDLMTGAEAVEEGAPETWIVAPEDVGVANRGQRRTEELGFNETLETLVTYFVGGAAEADPGELDAIRATIEGLRARDVEVIMVSMPVPDSFRALQPEGAPEALTAAVDDVATELGVDHLDLSRSMPEETFADYTHLTGTGASEFTRLLLDELDRRDGD